MRCDVRRAWHLLYYILVGLALEEGLCLVRVDKDIVKNKMVIENDKCKKATLIDIYTRAYIVFTL